MAIRKRRQTVRQVLDHIDRFLTQEAKRGGLLVTENRGRDLWDVLSALRGPDNTEQQRLKFSTTVPIRRAAFPRYAKLRETGKALSGVGADFNTRTQYVVPDSISDPDFKFYHWRHHVGKAAKVLKLVND